MASDKPEQTAATDVSPPAAPAGEQSTFETEAEEATPSLLVEFWWFIKENKAWWLIPLLLAFLLLGAVVWLSGSPLAPFIYPLF